MLAFVMAKAEEVAREEILDWAGQAWPVWPVDDDGNPLRADIGCIHHWQGINTVKIESCTHLPDEDEGDENCQFKVFEVKATVTRWGRGSEFEDENYELDFSETIWVTVASNGKNYKVIDTEHEDVCQLPDDDGGDRATIDPVQLLAAKGWNY
ncbi:MAG: hypothetical protein ICV62_15990 [Cyanobacteria bacterium Co-bin13]|nr:hypothetical protein [Cyanobacteria bacterium Co-bin13]